MAAPTVQGECRVWFRRLASDGVGGWRHRVTRGTGQRQSVNHSNGSARCRQRRARVRSSRGQAARAAGGVSGRGGDRLGQAVERGAVDRRGAEAGRVVQLDQLGEGRRGGVAGGLDARGQLAAGLAGAAGKAAPLERLERAPVGVQRGGAAADAHRRQAAPAPGAPREHQPGERAADADRPAARARATKCSSASRLVPSCAQRPTERASSTCLPRSYSMTYLNQASSTLSSIWRSVFHAPDDATAAPGGVGSMVTQPAPST